MPRRCHLTSPQDAYRPCVSCHRQVTKHYNPYKGMGVGFCAFGTGTSGALEPDACRLLKHISYARTTLEFQARGLDGVGRDHEEYKRAAGRAFRRTLMNCTAMLTLSGLYQRLSEPLTNMALLPS